MRNVELTELEAGKLRTVIKVTVAANIAVMTDKNPWAHASIKRENKILESVERKLRKQRRKKVEEV